MVEMEKSMRKGKPNSPEWGSRSKPPELEARRPPMAVFATVEPMARDKHHQVRTIEVSSMVVVAQRETAWAGGSGLVKLVAKHSTR